ncbi:TRAP transporter large permease [Candidatus Atribacteria bacterium 1244-E10-H5-B2]|nr:MAG: TRAP transporter large permease [Candidatus Atribacteria bacterium 1244-E10-H5-B2]
MSSLTIVFLFVIFLIFLIVIGLPLFACFAIICFGMMKVFNLGTSFAIPSIFVSLNSFTLMAIPFFVFSGGLMAESGMSSKIVDFINNIVGRVKGGLGFVLIVSCGFFGAITGSSAAAISAIGVAMLPELDKYGYSRSYSTALLACSGLLGQLIPPSIPLILFGMITGTSVAACWLSTVVPGSLLIIIYGIINYFFCRKNTEIKEIKSVSFKNILFSVRKGGFALLMPVIILGGIYGGLFTPTEGGAVGVAYALLIGFVIYKKLNTKIFLSVTKESISMLGSVYFIIMFILILSRIFTLERLPMILAENITKISSNRIIILLLINTMLLIIGMLMDDISSMLICAPLLFPLFMKLGVSPLQMAAILAVNQGTGMLTPPVATNLFFASRVGKVPVPEFIRYTIPYLVFGNIPVLLMVTFIPQLSTWLPQLVLGR